MKPTLLISSMAFVESAIAAAQIVKMSTVCFRFWAGHAKANAIMNVTKYAPKRLRVPLTKP